MDSPRASESEGNVDDDNEDDDDESAAVSRSESLSEPLIVVTPSLTGMAFPPPARA